MIVGLVEMISVPKPENIMGEILIRRSRNRTDVEETGADANLCKQLETRHRDESFPSDQSAHKSDVEKKYKVGMGWYERCDIKSVFCNELFHQSSSFCKNEITD